MTHPIPRHTTSTTGHRLGHSRASAARAAAAALALALLASSALVAAVKIEHDPVEKSKSGHRIELEAKIQDKAVGVREARAYFKSGHDTRFWFAPLRPVGDKHVGILPAPALGAKTVEYRIYAVNGLQDFVKTQIYKIQIKDDEEALARMEAKEPTNVEIDLDQIEQMRDLARQGGEPDPSTQVEVRNDVPGSEMPSSIPGFQDYIVLAEASPAAAGAGLAGAATVKAGGAGIGAGAVVGTTLVLGGLAAGATALDSSDDEGGGGGGDGATQQSVTLRNSGVDNIHICIDCTGADFNTGNRIGPGGTRTLSIPIPAGQQSVSKLFRAGRNSNVLTSATCSVSRGGSRTVRYTETGFGVNPSLLCE
jgi:hypothetical protein